MQEISIWPYEQMVYALLNFSPGEWYTQTLLGFWHPNGSLNLGQTTRHYNNNNEKRTYKIVAFAVPADHRVKLKESEEKDKLKKLCNMKVTFIQIIIGALGTATEGLIKGQEDLEIRGRVVTIQITALLRSVRILRRVLETWGDLQSLSLQWKTIS